MNKVKHWVVDLTGDFPGHAQTVTYLDQQGREIAAYSNEQPIAEYLDIFEDRTGKRLTLVSDARMDELLDQYHAKLVTDPAEITKADFCDALEVLPPVNWTNAGGFEHFRMSEHYTGPITTQYGRIGEKYLSKRIDVTRRETWLRPSDFDEGRQHG